MNIQCYYDGYDQDEDDDSNNSESESSGDEVEKDVLTFFKSKNIKTSLSKSELADEFEAEMSQQLDSLISGIFSDRYTLKICSQQKYT